MNTALHFNLPNRDASFRRRGADQARSRREDCSSARRILRMAGACLLVLTAFPLPGRAASSFVDGLPNFVTVDSAVDADGSIYVLGQRGGNAVLKRYDTSGSPRVWATNSTDTTNVIFERIISGISPTAFFITPGTNGIFLVGGSGISRLNKNTGASEITRAGPTVLTLKDVYYRNGFVYLCGHFRGSSTTIFGKSATARGTQAGVIIKLAESLPATAQELVTFGFAGDDVANSIVVDDSGDVYVGGHLSSGGTFGADFGLTEQWTVLTRRSSQQVNTLTDAQNVLDGFNVASSQLSSYDVIDFLGGGNGGFFGVNNSFPNSAANDFVMRATGLIQIPDPGGLYQFHINTDDGAWLSIDGIRVIHDDSRHGARDTTVNVSMAPGLHSVEFVQFERDGSEAAELSYTPPLGVRTLLRTAGTAGGNKGYIFKVGSALTPIKGVYYSTVQMAGQGGEILELQYNQGWVYGVGYWKGTANNPEVGQPDLSRFSQDLEVLKLDTDLVLKGRATAKSSRDNRGLSITSDDTGNVYLTGTFGNGSVDFIGENDRDATDATKDRTFTSISSSVQSLFVAKLDRNMNYEWVRQPDAISSDAILASADVRWNSRLQKLIWTGYLGDGEITLGEAETPVTLNGAQGFLSVFDSDRKFTQRVRLTIISDFGVSGTQVLPYGGPEEVGGPTQLNSRHLIKGSEVVASVPVYLYLDLNGNDITIQTDADESLIDTDAETRIRSSGYSVDGNVPVGEASSYRFNLDHDTTVKFNWMEEHALDVRSDFIDTAGVLVDEITSGAAGNPVPSVKKHWIPANESIIANIDSEFLDFAHPSPPIKYVVTGYRAFGPPAVERGGTNGQFFALGGPELRREVAEFLMTGPSKITWVWELRLGIQVDTTGPGSAHLPFVRVLKDFPGQTGPPTQMSHTGAGTFFYREHTVLQIGSIASQGMQRLRGWLNGDRVVFPSTGTVPDSPLNNEYYLAVADLTAPARVIWDYGDRIFREIVTIGNSVTFTNVDDLAIRNILISNEPPARVEVVSGPQGSSGDQMAIWDDTGKRLFPVRPGEVLSYWKTSSTDTNARIILRITIQYPSSPHYHHIALTPPVNLDPGTNDLVQFREVQFTEATTGANVDGQGGFTATGAGKTVLLFSELSGPGRAGELATLRVRVVQTRVWNDQLPGIQRAVIGRKITSTYDTAELDTGFVFFEQARYNPFIYDRLNVRGPVIPVNLHPTAGPNEQLVVVWYERRDKILWPYQAVRYEPDWPTQAEGLNRIVIASRFGSESVATNGTDQIVSPTMTLGTNEVPAEVTFNPTRFQQVQIYNQPVSTNAGYNPNEEHALMAPSLRYADVSPRPMAAYALRTGDLNQTNRDNTYISAPYVLVQFFDALEEEFKMKVHHIVREDSNLDLGELSYRYAFEQSMEAGEPVIPFYPLPFVIGATPCEGSYGREGDPNRRTYWKDHKGTPWAVSGDGIFYSYLMYPLQVDFWWPADFRRDPGECVPFLPVVPTSVTDRATRYNSYLGVNRFAIDYRLPNQTPAAQPITNTTVWPQEVPVLKVGETLTFAGGEYAADNPFTLVDTPEGDVVMVDTPGLPGVVAFAAGEIVFDNLNPAMAEPQLVSNYTARILSALDERTVDLPFNQFPTALAPANKRTRVKDGKYFFVDLPASLQKRVSYDPIRQKLVFIGFLNDKEIGDSTLTAAPGAVYVLEPNIMTTAEKDLFSGAPLESPFHDLGSAWGDKVRALYQFSRNPNRIDRDNSGSADDTYYAGLEQQIIRTAAGDPVTTNDAFGIVRVLRDKTKVAPLRALGPGLALVANPAFLDPQASTPQVSYVTVAENNDPALGGSPVTLHVIKVDKNQRYRGAIKVVLSDNVFDENVVLRHTGDFGAFADDLVFEWWYRPEDGTDARTPDIQPAPNPWKLFADPSGAKGQGFFQLTLKGNPSAPEALLADSLFFVRYRHRNEIPDAPQRLTWQGIPFQWAGAGNSSPLDVDLDGFADYRPQLAEGWVKRVLNAVNPYEARIRDFSGNNPATYSGMIREFGQRFEGPVALNPDQNVIENVGLIALYETIFDRAKNLSIDLSTPISTPGIANALELASTRLADFYMLLGNEAYADALNPTIGFGSDSVEYGSLAPAVFCFQNQLSSLLDEELALLRGQDENKARPVYNRLFWNFTTGEGEAAYAQNYHVTDVNNDGFINEDDALILYPQGHGDAWGHYLTALSYQYELLRHPFFNWVSRSEFVNLQDIVITVDYLDERKFAQVAAAKAKVAAEIVNITYREKYVSDPDGQWQGYSDTDKNRAWGFEEWSRRAGQGAYFDWITANALLPAHHPNTNLTGLRKIDRTTVDDIAVISANHILIQTKLDEANNGNNPVGVANDALTFDIDPTFLEVGSTAQIGSRAVQGLFHFDQIFERSLQALKNARAAFDNANEIQNMIRQVANSEEEFRNDVFQQDLAYRNQLIEIFGTPYEGTIGPGKAFPAGYQGPDTMLFMYVDVREITEQTVPRPTVAYTNGYLAEVGAGGVLRINNGFRTLYAETFQGNNPTPIQSVNYTDFNNPSTVRVPLLGNLALPVRAVGYTFQAPPDFGRRSSPGELQGLISQMLQAEGEVASAIAEWDALQGQILRELRLVNARFNITDSINNELGEQIKEEIGLRTGELVAKTAAGILNAVGDTFEDSENALVEAVPKNGPTGGLSVSLGDTPGSIIRSVLKFIGAVLVAGVRFEAAALEGVAGGLEIKREIGALQRNQEINRLEKDFEMREHLVELENTVGGEAIKRIEIFNKIQVLHELSEQYRAKLAQGLRLIQERTAFNKRTAAMAQRNRYQDMTFRVARNGALEKYRSAFDLAARYVYLSAVTYDYETNLDPNDAGSPVDTFGEIVKARTVGIFNGDDQPAAGGGGLTESLAILKANYDLLKTRMGFNNPQIEVTTFSLRAEKFRIPAEGETNAAIWRQTLDSAEIYKDDLWQMPEFRQYCRPFAPSTNGPQPGLVISFSSFVSPGSNFFGLPLGGGDNSYDPSVYSTKIQSVGLYFEGYPTDELSATPRIYLIPVGTDIITIPNSQNLEVRLWKIKEQSIPVAFPSTSAQLNNPFWRPLIDSLPTPFGEIRRSSSFRAYGFSLDDLAALDAAGASPEEQLTVETRLIARSVWNTRWLVIIPGLTLNADPVHGLKTFLHGKLVNPNDDPVAGERDGQGVTDIKLVLRTYGFSGN